MNIGLTSIWDARLGSIAIDSIRNVIKSILFLKYDI